MKQLIFGNLGTKLMALFLGVLLWVYLYTKENSQKTFDAPFHPVLSLSAEKADDYYVEYPAEGGRLVPGRSTIEVTIEGPRDEINKLREIRFAPTFDKDSFTKDVETFEHEITLKDFGLSDTYRLVRSESGVKKIKVHYAQYVEHEVELDVGADDLEGTPAPGYRVQDIRCLPPRIRVRVPVDKQVDSIDIASVPVQDLTESKMLIGRIDEAFSFVRPPAGEETISFQVEIRIKPEPFAKQLGPIILRLEADPKVKDRLRLDTSTIFIRVEGPPHIVNALQEDEIKVFVPIDLKPGDLPPGGERRPISASSFRHYFQKNPGSDLDIEYMPDMELENRQVTLIILPENER
ncbi:MAG: YbbR-like domain-containing protein [Planctomycetota bacterium]|jgi:YbbR domain-containing protein